jgi:hypothetical protein
MDSLQNLREKKQSLEILALEAEMAAAQSELEKRQVKLF